MQYSKLVREYLSSSMAITLEELLALKALYGRYKAGDNFENISPPIQLFNGLDDVTDQSEKPSRNNILVLPIEGSMSRSGGCFSMGANEMASILENAWQDDTIGAVVLRNHSGGGSVHSIVPISNALKRKNKPVLAAVDSVSGSANLYVSVFADEIIATHEMAEVGSVGVMAQVLNDDKAMENEGLKLEIIIPPESNYKNKAILEARDGNPDLLIKEELTPWARHFQEVVRNNRSKLDMSMEGILNGRMFYAFDAIENGLIDSIMPFDEVLQRASELAERNSISSIYK